MEKLPELKLLLGITDTSQDELLLVLLTQAADFIVAYCRNPVLTEATFSACLNNAQVQIAAMAYRNLGLEGLQSYTEGALALHFAAAEQTVPAAAQTALRQARNIGLYEVPVLEEEPLTGEEPL